MTYLPAGHLLGVLQLSRHAIIIGGQLEAGSGLDEYGQRTHPADFLVQNWEFLKPADLEPK